MTEIQLSGGKLDGAVRVGDTVRRKAGPWTATIHEFLNHVRDRGFRFAPRPIGIDELGREVLEYIPGETIGDAYPWPKWVWSESLLAQVGQATAALHAAAADFQPSAPGRWRFVEGTPAAGEVVCHCDLAPYNVVVGDGQLRAVIDWDLARPAKTRAEVAFVAWEWVPLWHPDSARGLGWDSPPDIERRLRVLLDSYGLADRSGFFDAVINVVGARAAAIQRLADVGVTGFVRLVEEGQVANIEKTATYLRANRDRLQALLGT